MLFYLAMGFFMTHELDAVASHEWRILPLTAWMPDETGYHFFVLAHIPLVALMFFLISNANQKIQSRSKVWISLFLIAHGILHLLYVDHAHYEFNSFMSSLLIFGASICALAFLLLGRKKSL